MGIAPLCWQNTFIYLLFENMSVSTHISFLPQRWGFKHQSLQELHSQLPTETFGISVEKNQ